MVTKTEYLKKFNSSQLKEIATCEKIKIPKGARKAGLIESLILLPMATIKKYAKEYLIETTITKTTENKEKKLSAYQRGHDLEKRTAAWLRKTFGFKTKLNDLVNGKAVKRPYEVDCHAIKESFFGDTHIWVECKSLNVKRTHIAKLVSTAEDVEDAKEGGIAKWKGDVLLMVSDTGYDIDALGWADKKKVYCVLANKTFKFVSKRKLQDFKDEF